MYYILLFFKICSNYVLSGQSDWSAEVFFAGSVGTSSVSGGLVCGDALGTTMGAVNAAREGSAMT